MLPCDLFLYLYLKRSSTGQIWYILESRDVCVHLILCLFWLCHPSSKYSNYSVMEMSSVLFFRWSEYQDTACLLCPQIQLHSYPPEVVNKIHFWNVSCVTSVDNEWSPDKNILTHLSHHYQITLRLVMFYAAVFLTFWLCWFCTEEFQTPCSTPHGSEASISESQTLTDLSMPSKVGAFQKSSFTDLTLHQKLYDRWVVPVGHLTVWRVL
jgi:hypothetical protein